MEGSSGLRVLVADDDALMRLLVRRALGDAACTVVAEAADGAEAVSLAAGTQPDVIVLDHEMPVLKGLDALPRILEAAPSARVVLFTGSLTAEVRARAAAWGATVIEKDGSMGALMDAISRRPADDASDEAPEP